MDPFWPISKDHPSPDLLLLALRPATPGSLDHGRATANQAYFAASRRTVGLKSGSRPAWTDSTRRCFDASIRQNRISIPACFDPLLKSQFRSTDQKLQAKLHMQHSTAQHNNTLCSTSAFSS
ncbi:hypothetical protein Tsp_12872, partial [Trichinella spiralis]|uniref:hypothetical protein n=1 Tax=Trichinella spiralis TaxID=6334 RepID=UPI0001EFD417